MRESILAIELSQRAGSIALRPRVDADLVEMAVPPSDDANDHLMATIDELCRAHRVRPHELAAIAVSCGRVVTNPADPSTIPQPTMESDSIGQRPKRVDSHPTASAPGRATHWTRSTKLTSAGGSR